MYTNKAYFEVESPDEQKCDKKRCVKPALMLLIAVGAVAALYATQHRNKQAEMKSLLAAKPKVVVRQDKGPTPQYKFVNSDRLKMYYQLWPQKSGQPKTPVIILGGWMSVKEDWEDVAERWSSIRPILTVDPRGFGQTGLGPTAGDYTAPQLAGDIADLVGQLFNEKIFLVGAAIGGKIALQLSVDSPDLFKAVIPAATVAGGDLSVAGPRRESFIELVSSGEWKNKPFEYAEAIYSPEWVSNNYWTVLRIFWKGSQYNRPQEGIDRMLNIATQYDISGEVHAKKVKLPTLCLHGTHDQIADAESSRLLCAAIGDHAEFEQLQLEGHAFWFMDPVEFIDDTETFFATVQT